MEHHPIAAVPGPAGSRLAGSDLARILRLEREMEQLQVCDVCGALVPPNQVGVHDDWHSRTATQADLEKLTGRVSNRG